MIYPGESISVSAEQTIHFMIDVNIVPKQTGTILSTGINTYFNLLCMVFMASDLEHNCHTVYIDDTHQFTYTRHILMKQQYTDLMKLTFPDYQFPGFILILVGGKKMFNQKSIIKYFISWNMNGHNPGNPWRTYNYILH